MNGITFGWRTSRPLLFLLSSAVAISGCAMEVAEEASDLGEADDEMVIGDTSDFQLLSTLETAHPNPTDTQVEALYGRATGLIGFGGCSSFLIDDDVVVTAEHCRNTNQNTTTVTFGLYGPGAGTGNFSGAWLDALVRGMQLGIPVSLLFSAGFITNLTTWNCYAHTLSSGRDIEYYRCNPNLVTWTESNGVTITLRLLPGHIWGHFNTVHHGVAKNDPVRAFGINPRCGDSTRSVVASPGKIVDAVNDCSGNYNHCFEHSADIITGHSGGPIMRRTDHVVYGVQSSHTFASWDSDETSDPCGDSTPWHTENRAAKIASDVLIFTGSSLDGGAEPTGPFNGFGNWVGGFGGMGRTLTCPANYLAAGVLGSTASSGWLGNVGFVCMPKQDPIGPGASATVTYQLDRAVVVAGGSFDTGFANTFGTDFNTYFNEALSDTATGPFQQWLQMCPPGMFMRGIDAFASNYVGSVDAIECAPPSQAANPVVVDVAALGNLDASDGLAAESSRCPAGDSFVFGLQLNSGWHTDGLRTRCRRSIP